MPLRKTLLVTLTLLCSIQAKALLLYGLDNTANLTDPATGAPWDAVAKVTDATGAANSGSCVHIGGGYMVTANHVGIGSGYVTFDGVTTYAVDTSYAPVRFDGVTDAKVFKLQSIPAGAATILTTASEKIAAASPGSQTAAAVTLVGWGLGRNATPVNTSTVGWGGSTAKRWGTNTLNTFSLLAPCSQPAYSFLTTHVGQGSATEAGLATLDSGSGLFQQISGQWYLVGIATLVTQIGGTSTTTFGATDTYKAASGDENIFVRVSSYSTQISAAVPEPSTYAGCAAFTLTLLAIRRRQRSKIRANAA